MTSYERGDVVLLLFPFTDLSAAKRRPAVVLSTNDYNARRPDLIVAPITSSCLATHGLLRAERLASCRPGKAFRGEADLRNVEKTQVVRKLGSISATDMRRVEQFVALAMGLKV